MLIPCFFAIFILFSKECFSINSKLESFFNPSEYVIELYILLKKIVIIFNHFFDPFDPFDPSNFCGIFLITVCNYFMKTGLIIISIIPAL